MHNGFRNAPVNTLPHGNHGEISGDRMASQLPPLNERNRLSIELSEVVSSHLGHISEVTGATKAAIVSAALLDALPELLARADVLKKRHAELSQVKKK